MSERESRGRCLLVSCFVGGVILALFGLYRWPPQTAARPLGGSFTKAARVVDQHVFIVDRSRFDVAIGLADYLSSALLFALGVVFWYRGLPRWRRRARSIEVRTDDPLPLIFVPLSVLAGVAVLLLGAGALASVVQA